MHCLLFISPHQKSYFAGMISGSSEEEEYDLCLANMNGDLFLPLFIGDPVDSVVIPDVDLMIPQCFRYFAEPDLVLGIVTDKYIRLCISGVEA